jgi:biopolymer transport protein ExbD
MVAAPMATVSIALDLPPASKEPPPGKPKEPVFVSVQQSGAIFIGPTQSSLAALPYDIQNQMIKNGTTGNFTEERVFVRADAEVKYESFMAVLNVLQANGYFKIGLINEDIE